MSYDGKRKTRMIPNGEEEDWEEEEELRYIITNKKTWNKDEAAELRSRFGFMLIGNKWQRDKEMSDDDLCDLEDLGYEILEK